MSLQTWKDEFYNVPAEEAAESPLSAAQHSLKKWRGLTTENLERHGMMKEGESRNIWNGWGGRFNVDGYTCALCISVDDNCRKCGLWELGYGCKDDQEYGMWYYQDDPLPMITALEKLVDKLNSEQKKLNTKIPNGIYCYDENGVCPYWGIDPSKPEQDNGYCTYLNKNDWEDLGVGLLWDQVKLCTENNCIEDDEMV
jgi:hypothetical protein